MPEDIVIQGNVISFPATGEEPDWSEAVIQFAEAVAAALEGVVGPFDVSPQVYTMTSNVNNNVSLPSLQFPTTTVRAATVRYSVFRNTDSANAAEAGIIQVLYNPNNPINQKWELVQQKVGEGNITFSILDTGQIQFTSTAITGSNHVGKISYAAQALTQV